MRMNATKCNFGLSAAKLFLSKRAYELANCAACVVDAATLVPRVEGSVAIRKIRMAESRPRAIWGVVKGASKLALAFAFVGAVLSYHVPHPWKLSALVLYGGYSLFANLFAVGFHPRNPFNTQEGFKPYPLHELLKKRFPQYVQEPK